MARRKVKSASFEPDYFKRDRSQDKAYRQARKKIASENPSKERNTSFAFKRKTSGKFKNPYGWP